MQSNNGLIIKIFILLFISFLVTSCVPNYSHPYYQQHQTRKDEPIETKVEPQPVVKSVTKDVPIIIIIGKDDIQRIEIPQKFDKDYQEFLESIDKFLKKIDHK